MAGNRESKLVELAYAPGVVTNTTDRGAKGRYKDSNRVRWHKGLPEKIAGWTRLTLASTVDAVVVPDPPVVGAAVAYVPGSKDTFSPTAATSMTLTMVNADVDPATYPDAVAVLSLTAVMNSAPGTTVNPTAITIGGIAADIIGQSSLITYFSVDRDTHAVVAMVRIPPGGFSDLDIDITWPSLVTASAGVRASVNVFYNVDESSDAFALGYVLGDDVASIGPLSVPSGGAVYVTNMQFTAGDWDAEAESDDATLYTMQSPDVSHGFSTFYMTGYRLFASIDASENLSPVEPGVNFTPGIAFVMDGTS